MRVIRPQGSFAGLLALPVKGFCLVILSPIKQQVGQIVHGSEAVNMFWTERPLTLRKASAKEFFRGGVFSLVLERQRLFLHRLGTEQDGGCGRSFGTLARNQGNGSDTQNDSENQERGDPKG